MPRPTRDKINAYVKRKPEATVRQIQKACKISSPSVVQYHLERLSTPRTICCPVCHGKGRVKPRSVGEPPNSGEGVTPESIRQQIEKARALEREACAVVADDQDECAHLMATKIAELIRARNGSSPTPEK